MSKEEGQLDFRQPARALHDRVRAFAGWPGTSGAFMALAEAPGGRTEAVDLKILATRLPGAGELPAGAVGGPGGAPGEVAFVDGRMLVPCGGGSVLEVLSVQPVGKKPMAARDFKNGLGRRRLLALARAGPPGSGGAGAGGGGN